MIKLVRRCAALALFLAGPLAVLPLAAQETSSELEGDPQVWRKEGEALRSWGGKRWSYATAKVEVPPDASIEADVTLEKPCSRKDKGDPLNWFRYAVQRDDAGYEASLLLRSFGSGLTESWWYRVQISSAYQEIALHKGNGGYVKVVPVEIPLGKALRVKAEARGDRIRAWLDGKLVIDFQDRVAPVRAPGGKWGVGAFESQVRFEHVRIARPSEDPLPPAPERKYEMSTRTWHGDLWIFSDDEPIAHVSQDKLAEIKLVPGYQPQLLAPLAWEESSQQPSKIDEAKPLPAARSPAEASIEIRGRTVSPKAEVRTRVSARFDRTKGFYTYDFESCATLENAASPGAGSFAFTYIMPYSPSPNAWGNWTYEPGRHLDLFASPLPESVIRADDAAYYHWEFFRGQDGLLYRVPVRIDWDYNVPDSFRTRLYSAPSLGVKPDMREGRTWVRGPHPVSNPSVTFLDKEPSGDPACAVCCFSHETHLGWAFPPAKLKSPELRAHYRYSGVSPSEMARLMLVSRLPSHPVLKRLRVLHKPGLNRFGADQQVSVADPLVSVPWIGPYDVDQTIGFDDTSSILLEGGGWAEWKPLLANGYGPGVHPLGYDPSPRTLISLAYRTVGVRGRGLYLEVVRDREKERHYFGSDPSGKWTPAGLVSRLLAEKGKAAFRIGLDGAGRAWVDNVEVRPLAPDEPVPAGTAENSSGPRDLPERLKALPPGLVSAWGLDESAGLLAYDWIGGRHLEFRNPLWGEAEGRRGVRLSPEFDQAFGATRGDFDAPERTIAFWFRPDEVPGKPAYWGISLLTQQRRVTVTLSKQGRPGVLLEFGDATGKFTTASAGAANGRALAATKDLTPKSWQHLALVCAKEEGRAGRATLYLDGEIVADARFEGQINAGAAALTLGCDPHQADESRAWGMYSDVQCYGRALKTDEIRKLAAVK